jgi:hypothetical protein
MNLNSEQLGAVGLAGEVVDGAGCCGCSCRME